MSRARAALAGLALTACNLPLGASGVGEPVRVRGGTFLAGTLPGAPPGDASLEGATPRITAIESAAGIVAPRQAGKSVSGRATPDAYSVALALRGAGTGYWVVPVGAPDPAQQGELGWGLTLDFGDGVAPGLYALRLAALDGQGNAGPQREVPVCVVPAVPDNLNACDDTIAPPDTVFSLSWDTNVDLDLVVQTPEGRTLDWKHPSTAIPDGGRVDPASLRSPDLGTLDRDSNANCAIDSLRREDLVWQGTPRAGTWRVYANLYSACGQGAVTFRFTVLRRAGDADAGHFQLTERLRVDGTLSALDANGGAQRGTLLAEVTLP